MLVMGQEKGAMLHLQDLNEMTYLYLMVRHTLNASTNLVRTHGKIVAILDVGHVECILMLISLRVWLSNMEGVSRVMKQIGHDTLR